MNKIIRLSLLLFAVMCLPLTIYAQPSLSGDVSGTLGPGEYLVDGNCTIPSGEILTIEPGTTFLFTGHYYFSVYGELTAVGTETDSIKFLPDPESPGTRHAGIRFQSTASPESELAYCLIDNAINQSFPIYNGGALFSSGVDLNISHCVLSNSKANKGGGIYIQNAVLNVSSCVFEADSAYDGAGIFASGSEVNISGNSFFHNRCYNSGNGGAIFLDNSDEALIDGNIMVFNHSDGT